MREKNHNSELRTTNNVRGQKLLNRPNTWKVKDTKTPLCHGVKKVAGGCWLASWHVYIGHYRYIFGGKKKVDGWMVGYSNKTERQAGSNPGKPQRERVVMSQNISYYKQQRERLRWYREGDRILMNWKGEWTREPIKEEPQPQLTSSICTDVNKWHY